MPARTRPPQAAPTRSSLSRSLSLVLALAPALSLCGCGSGTGGGSSAATHSVGPHGGTAVALPGEKGYAEVVLDRSGVKPGKAGGAKIQAYFLGKDARTPLASPPTSATLSLTIPGKDEPVSASMSPDAAASKPADKGRLTTPPGDFDYDELRGELSATVDGQAATIPFSFR